MLKTLLLIIFFRLIQKSSGKESNEILSILPNASNDIFTREDGAYSLSQTVFPNNKSTELVKTSNRRLLRILNLNVPSLVCYPESEEEHRNVYTLSHITCRQSGYMTLTAIKAKMSHLNKARIKPQNIICSDTQRSCKLLQNETEDCRTVVEVTCGSCNETVKGFRGMIKSPGFPFASFADVTCEWNIIVPEHHAITLSFNLFDSLNVDSAALPCNLQNPYVNIMYGIQGKVTVHRYCRLDEVRNLSIPFHSVKVITFAGIQAKRETMLQKREFGISITFEAIAPTEEYFGSPSKMLALFLLGVSFIACIILCHYIQKHKLCDCIIKDKGIGFFAHPPEQACDLHNYNRTQNEAFNVNKSSSHVEKAELQRDSKLAYETDEKACNEYSSLLEPSARYIPGIAEVNGVSADAVKLNANLHKKLNFTRSYHGQSDPNRLSVSSPRDYFDYPSSMYASSPSKSENKRLKVCLSTC